MLLFNENNNKDENDDADDIASNSNNGGGALNACLKCDEKMCGPAFITCAGANRRRSGIISDIERDVESDSTSVEICEFVDVGWDK
jgi:hypothetical protein